MSTRTRRKVKCKSEIGSTGHESCSFVEWSRKSSLTETFVKMREGSKRVSYINMWRKKIPNKGHSNFEGPEAGGLDLFEHIQGSQGLELSH